LCWACYYRPGVRDCYPSTSKFARHGVEDFNGCSSPPARPTRALPGTPEKVAVLERRAQAGQSLWHPLDARLDSRRRRSRHSDAVSEDSLQLQTA
jgi:hypothetical protein